MKHRLAPIVIGFCALGLCRCGGPEEAPGVELPVYADPGGITNVTTDLGYTVELTEARAMVENVAFTIAGEAHMASIWSWVSDILIPAAHAHPGHFQGGDVTGELRGRFVLSWLPGREKEIGRATLLVGTYKAANFTFALAGEQDGVAGNDLLLGHTAVLRGSARRNNRTVDFTATIDSPEGRELVGAPFEAEIRQSTRESLGIRLVPENPLEGDTLFDGLDFTGLDTDGDGTLVIEATSSDKAVVEAYNLLRRSFQTHDHFDVKPSLRTF